MSVWFTSDLHFGHRKVAGYRGFGEDVEAHDTRLIVEWCERVSPKDDVWVLGDIAASSPTHALSILRTLPGRKHLVSGNHDRCHPMHRDAHNRQDEYRVAFDSVQSSARRRINGTEVLLSHFPYVRDRDEPRYTQWRLPNEGKWLLHGHTHGTERRTISSVPLGAVFVGTTPRAKEIHVGVDAWDMAPVSLDEIGELISAEV